MKILDITPKETQIVLRKDSGLVTAEALEREEETRKLIKGYISKNLKKGTDYYELQIGGRTSKPSLSKPGAEKFMSLFHLRAEFERDNDTWEMMGKKDGVLCYVCKLYTKSGQLVGEGRGARDVHKDGDINKTIKMAQKSANIDAVLRVGALSEMFTQDLKDWAARGGQGLPLKEPAPPAPPARSAPRARLFAGLGCGSFGPPDRLGNPALDLCRRLLSGQPKARPEKGLRRRVGRSVFDQMGIAHVGISDSHRRRIVRHHSRAARLAIGRGCLARPGDGHTCQ